MLIYITAVKKRHFNLNNDRHRTSYYSPECLGIRISTLANHASQSRTQYSTCSPQNTSGLVVRASARRSEGRGFESYLGLNFSSSRHWLGRSTSSHTSQHCNTSFHKIGCKLTPFQWLSQTPRLYKCMPHLWKPQCKRLHLQRNH